MELLLDMHLQNLRPWQDSVRPHFRVCSFFAFLQLLGNYQRLQGADLRFYFY